MADAAQPILIVEHLAKSFGEGSKTVEAIADLSFSVGEREFLCVVGPSGCGKTTLLRCASGLIEPARGEIRLRGQLLAGPPPEMTIVFQEYSRSLMPWLTVTDNVELPLRHKKGLPKAERRQLVQEALSSVELAAVAEKYPWQLSGGMQQRVAIARALAYQPQILLMDEPFASVDAQTRATLEDLVLRVHHRYGITVLFVTHDIDEAVYLADRVIVLTRGPTRVHEELPVNLPRPRDQVETKALPEFARLRTHVFRGIVQDPGQARAAVGQGS